METFNVRNEQDTTIIDWENSAFIIKVNKNRKLSAADKRAVIEATLYKEENTFVKECDFVFEACDKDKKPLQDRVDIDIFNAAITFFFCSVLSTTYFIVNVPAFSSMFKEPDLKIDNVTTINTANLYNILSGY